MTNGAVPAHGGEKCTPGPRDEVTKQWTFDSVQEFWDSKISSRLTASVRYCSLAGQLLKGIVENVKPGPEDLASETKQVVVEHQRDPELRDTEQIPLLHRGGIDAFLAKEVLPYPPVAWYLTGRVKIAYTIGFSQHFCKPKPMKRRRKYGLIYWRGSMRRRGY